MVKNQTFTNWEWFIVDDGSSDNSVEIIKKYFYTLRHAIKPGLTGWAQVEYLYANTVEDQEMKLRYDLYYIKERSALLDLRILLKTINTVLFHKGY